MENKYSKSAVRAKGISSWPLRVRGSVYVLGVLFPKTALYLKYIIIMSVCLSVCLFVYLLSVCLKI